MTALWFDHLRPQDRVSVKPHASPVLHAINYLLGELDESYLPRLREFGGLQSYPSRIKGPRSRRLLHRIGRHRCDRADLGRDVPTLRRHRLRRRAESGGSTRWSATPSWTRAPCGRPCSTPWSPSWASSSGSSTSTASRWTGSCPTSPPTSCSGCSPPPAGRSSQLKYGSLLEELFTRPGGAELRQRIDAMTNPEYQRLLRCDAAELRRRLPGDGPSAQAIDELVASLDDTTLVDAIAQPRRTRPGGAGPRSGHDRRHPAHGDLRLHHQRLRPGRPKGHPQNHSALLTDDRCASWPRAWAPIWTTRGARSPTAVRADELLRARPRDACTATRSRAFPRPRSPSTSAAPRRAPPPPRPRWAVLCSTSPAKHPTPRGASSPSAPTSAPPPTWAAGSTRSACGRPGTAELVRRRCRDHPALAGETHRPAHRARHRRGQPGRPDRRAGRDLESLGPTPAADRCALRPVRRTGPGTVVLRHLRRWPVDPGRHPVRCHPRPRGRGAPVDQDAVDRSGAARLPHLRAGVRPGRRMDAARRSRPARQARRLARPTCGCPPGPSTSHWPPCPTDPAARERRRRQVVAGAYALRRTENRQVTIAAMGAVVPEALDAADRLDADRHPHGRGVRDQPRTCSSMPCAHARATNRPTPGSSTRSSPLNAPRRWSPSWTDTRTPCRSWPRSTASPPARSASPVSGNQARWRMSITITASTPTASSAPRSTSPSESRNERLWPHPQGTDVVVGLGLAGSSTE